MYKFILKRFLTTIPVLLGVTLAVFSLTYFTPGDPAAVVLGEQATAESIIALRKELGLNDSFIVQYLRFVKNIITLDIGRSYVTNSNVLDEIMARFPSTVVLTIFSVIVAIGISIPIGIISATRQYSAIDYSTMVIALLGVATPNFWLGLMLLLTFSVNPLFPALRLPSGGFNSWSSVILPSITLGTGAAAFLTRMTRSSMLEVIRQDYIRTARSKGVAQKTVIRKHALRNALIPIVTIVGLLFGGLLGGSVLTETIFSWPGVGRLLVTSIQKKDTPMILGSVVFIAVIYTFINLAVDILYGFIDPRIKSQYKKG